MSCQQAAVDDPDPDIHKGQLQFSPSLGPAQSTRVGELDNNTLVIASAAGENPPHIVIETYKGKPGSTLKPYFSDQLGYFSSGNYWDTNSGVTRYLPSGGMNLYAYFATGLSGKGDLSGVSYLHPDTEAEYPRLTIAVAADEALQVDLIAAKIENITEPDVPIPFRHILSQINFGVKGIDQHQITIKNIRINNIAGNGSFDYKSWQWTPDSKAAAQGYPYYFPDRKKGDTGSGQGANYKTLGTVDDSKNSYLFGDGGKFGPGESTTFLYAQVDPSASSYATKDKTPAALGNSLILLPQQITDNALATVSFDYEIRLNDWLVRSGTNETVRLDGYYDWSPNQRYVYLFKLDNPSQKVTFDVLVEPWQNFDDGDGIIGADELNGTTLFQKYVSEFKPGDKYTVPIGALTSDFICDWSLYSLANSFTEGQTFSLAFDNSISFANGKSVVINPPFGFKASASSLQVPGVVTFTALRSYFSTSAALNSALGSGGGNHEFNVRVCLKIFELKY